MFLAVLGAELGTVAGNESSTDQLKMSGHLHGGPEYLFDSGRVIPAEIGDGIVVRNESLHEPDELDVAFAFPFQCPGTSDPVEISVDKKP